MGNLSQLRLWSYMAGILVFTGGMVMLLGRYTIHPEHELDLGLETNSWVDDVSWAPDESSLSFTVYRSRGEITQVDAYAIYMDGTVAYEQHGSADTANLDSTPRDDAIIETSSGENTARFDAGNNRIFVSQGGGWERPAYPTSYIEEVTCPILKPGETGVIEAKIRNSTYWIQFVEAEAAPYDPRYYAWVGEEGIRYSSQTDPAFFQAVFISTYAFKSESVGVGEGNTRTLTWEITASEDSGLNIGDYSYIVVPMRVSLKANEVYSPDAWCNVIISKDKADMQMLGYGGALAGGLLALPLLFDAQRKMMAWQAILPFGVIAVIAFVVELFLR